MMFLNIQIGLLILKTRIRPAIYFSNQKIVAYHI